VLQRVSRARVTVGGAIVDEIGTGYLLLVGIEGGDGSADIDVAVRKIVALRVFPDETGKMNLGIGDVGGSILVVSQFTLAGDLRRGRRPSFTRAAAPDLAAPLIDEMIDGLRGHGIETGSGVFGAQMEVEIVNDGPLTLVFSVGNATLG
jgi:D-tyrosyl-tRNA(Tyr) deacylase